jgi:hypothetical protein
MGFPETPASLAILENRHLGSRSRREAALNGTTDDPRRPGNRGDLVAFRPSYDLALIEPST